MLSKIPSVKPGEDNYYLCNCKCFAFWPLENLEGIGVHSNRFVFRRKLYLRFCQESNPRPFDQEAGAVPLSYPCPQYNTNMNRYWLPVSYVPNASPSGPRHVLAKCCFRQYRNILQSSWLYLANRSGMVKQRNVSLCWSSFEKKKKKREKKREREPSSRTYAPNFRVSLFIQTHEQLMWNCSGDSSAFCFTWNTSFTRYSLEIMKSVPTGNSKVTAKVVLSDKVSSFDKAVRKAAINGQLSLELIPFPNSTCLRRV